MLPPLLWGCLGIVGMQRVLTFGFDAYYVARRNDCVAPAYLWHCVYLLLRIGDVLNRKRTINKEVIQPDKVAMS